MFQRGEVDYLVATDAIGMGLNMDVAHVAFAGLEKFDGRRDRRLTISEMAQIAGRAGRHQKDGSFGTLGLGGEDGGGFGEEEIAAIEDHRFRPLDFVYWRNAELDFPESEADRQPRGAKRRSVAPLRARSDRPRGAQAIAEDPAIAARKGDQARRLWAVCGLPDFRKVGPMHHSRMVRRLYSYIGEGGHMPHEWFAAEVARLDNMSGDIEVLADRLAGIRSWAYIAHRADWLAEPAKWAERTREVESRLSDALHERLTQRFVDRRTAVLVRDIGARGSDALPVTVAADGEVSVGPEPIGHLTGFEFRVDPTARLADKRLLLAAAERRLGEELERRARPWSARPTPPSSCSSRRTAGSAVAWQGHILARLAAGRSLLEPALAHRARPRPAVGSRPGGASLAARSLARRRRSSRHFARSKRLPRLRPIRPARPAFGRSRRCWPTPAAWFREKPCSGRFRTSSRPTARRCTSSACASARSTCSSNSLLKPAAQTWRAALLAVRSGQPMPGLPEARSGHAGRRRRPARRCARLSPARAHWLRIDLADRLASHARKVRSAGGEDPVDLDLARRSASTRPRSTSS